MIRGGTAIHLGMVRLGDEFSRLDSDVIDVNRNHRLQCNLTHIKIKALNDSVRILKVQVGYRNGRTDTIEIPELNPFRNGPARGFRGGRGFVLEAQESSPWLSVDDVQDGFASGQCITSIRLIGKDIPNNRFERRYGYSAPALVMVEGLLLQNRQGGGFDRGGRDHGGRGHFRPLPPPLPQFFIGALKFTLFKSDNEGFQNVNVTTPVRGLVFESESGAVYMNRFSVTCGNGSTCYKEEVASTVDRKVVMFPQPIIVKSINAKGSGGTVRVFAIK